MERAASEGNLLAIFRCLEEDRDYRGDPPFIMLGDLKGDGKI